MSSGKDQQDFIFLYRSTRTRELSAALIMLCGVLLVRSHAFFVLFSHALGGSSSDSGLYLWLLQQLNALNSETGWFNTGAFYPYTQTLAWSDNYILPALLSWPFLKIGLPVHFVHNLLLLMACWLNGFCCYKLAYKLSGQYYSSLLAGFCFLSLSFFTNNLGHPQLQYAFWILAGLLFLWKSLASKSHLIPALFGFSVFACFLTTVYYAIFLVLLSFIFVGLLLIMRPSANWKARLLPLGVWSILWSLMLIIFAVPYLNISKVFGERQIYEAYYFSADLGSLFASAPLSLVYSWTSGFSHAEALYFPGLLLYALASLAVFRLSQSKKLKILFALCLFSLLAALLCATQLRAQQLYGYLAAFFSWASIIFFLLHAYRLSRLEKQLGFEIVTDRSIISLLCGAALICLLLALGPLGNPEKAHMALGVFRLPYELFPGFSAIRAISRIGVLFLICCCLLLPFGVSYLFQLLKRPVSAAIVGLLGLLILLENYNTSFPLEPVQEPPLVFSILQNYEGQSELKRALVLPFTHELRPDGQVKSWGNFARLNVNYMNWATGRKIELVNGYSGIKSKIAREFPAKFRSFPDRRSLNTLSTLAAVEYIIVLPEFYQNFDHSTFESNLSKHSELKLLARDDRGNYLLHFTPKHRVHEEFSLRVPSYPQSQLSIDLMPAYREEQPLISIEIYEDDHTPGEPLSIFNVRADGRWTTKNIILPRVSQKARPLRLRFEVPDKQMLLIGKTSLNKIYD